MQRKFHSTIVAIRSYRKFITELSHVHLMSLKKYRSYLIMRQMESFIIRDLFKFQTQYFAVNSASHSNKFIWQRWKLAVFKFKLMVDERPFLASFTFQQVIF